MNESAFSQIDRYWSCQLSDGVQIDLKPNGKEVRVKFSEIQDYVSAVIEARLRESQPQYNAIKRGISKIIPCSLFNIVTSKELEVWACGKFTVDVDLLKRHTSYSGSYNPDHQTIQLFWEFLHEIREEEKQKFIKFCWG